MGGHVGDRQIQLSEFVAAHLKALRRAAFLLCGDWALADDLTQDALVRLATSVGRIRDPVAALAYTHRCLFRAFLDARRRSWRRETAVEHLPDVLTADDAPEIDSRLDVLAALQEIPARQRAVLVCRYYLDLDVAQTSAALHCSEGTVKSQTARGLAALRRVVDEPISEESR